MAGSAGLVGAAAVVAAHAAQAQFGSAGTAIAQSSVNAGHAYLSIPGAGNTNRMTLTVDNMYPARTDLTSPWRERAVDVTNGSVALTTLTISSIADTNNHLTGDTGSPGSGVLLIIDECPSSWDETLSGSEPTYTCAGAGIPSNPGNNVLGCKDCGNSGSPVDYDITPNVTSSYTWSTGGTPALTNIDFAAGHVNHLRFRFKLSYAAANAAQGQSANVTFTFDGTPRTGTNA